VAPKSLTSAMFADNLPIMKSKYTDTAPQIIYAVKADQLSV